MSEKNKSYYNLVKFTFPKICHRSHLMVFHWNKNNVLVFFLFLSNHIRILCPASCIAKWMCIAWTIVHCLSGSSDCNHVPKHSPQKVFWLIRPKPRFTSLSVWNTEAKTSERLKYTYTAFLLRRQQKGYTMCMSTEIHCVSAEKPCKKWLC